MRIVGRWLVWAVLLFIAYEVLEDSPVVDELVVGGIIAVTAALIVTWLYAVSNTRYSARWADLVHLSGVPFSILRDTFAVGGAIARSLFIADAMKGSVEQIPMEFGKQESSYAATRRALVTLGTSIAPNTVVCIVDQRGLFIHRLVGKQPAGLDRRWPL